MIKLKKHYLNILENKRRILFKLFLTLILGTQVCLSAFAQNGEITGKIVDRKTGEPIIGATIMVKNSKIGTISNINGEFQINTRIPLTLNVTYVGYKKAEININERKMLLIELSNKNSAYKSKSKTEKVRVNEEKDFNSSVNIANKATTTGCISGDCENGNGTLIDSNHIKYIGEFKNGRSHGYGALYDEIGNVICQGNWENGSFKSNNQNKSSSSNDEFAAIATILGGVASFAYHGTGAIVKKAVEVGFITKESLSNNSSSNQSDSNTNHDEIKKNAEENVNTNEISEDDYRNGNFNCPNYNEVDGWSDCIDKTFQACDYKFSDGIKGTLSFSKDCKKYCIGCSGGVTGFGLNTCRYYADKQTAIKALYCFKKTGGYMRGDIGCSE